MERVLLVGFMCAGKTSVGAALARRLGWQHLDFDREIVARVGRSVAEIFRDEGEPAFRRLEAALTAEAAALQRVVLTPGGGWISVAGLLESLRPATITVWLQASPETILARAARGPAERPLLDTPNPAATVAQLLREREARYALADFAVATDDVGVEEVVERIRAGIRKLGQPGTSPNQAEHGSS